MPPSAPATGANPPRHILADLYTQAERPVFDPDFQGVLKAMAHRSPIALTDLIDLSFERLLTAHFHSCALKFVRRIPTPMSTRSTSFARQLAAAESHSAAAASTKQSTASALLLMGLPWNRAAAPGLSAAAALTHLACHGDAPPQERCLAYAQLAQYAAEHRGHRAAEQVIDFPSSFPPR